MSLQEEIFDAIQASKNGLTCDELEATTNMGHSTVAGRINDLTKEGRVKKSGAKRKTRKGVRANVWIACVPGEEPVVTTADKAKTKARAEAQKSAKVFWTDIRQRIVAYASVKSTVDGGKFEQICKEFEVDLLDCTEQFQGRLKRAELPVQEISRRKVFEACRTLQIEPPKVGSAVNLAAAKRNKRRMVRAYHPDLAHNGTGNEMTRMMYEAVIEAYDLLEQYNHLHGSKPNGQKQET